MLLHGKEDYGMEQEQKKAVGILTDVIALLFAIVLLGMAAIVNWAWHWVAPEATVTLWQIWATLSIVGVIRMNIRRILSKNA